MNWQEEALQRLKQYECARHATESMAAEVQRLENILYTPGTARTDAPVRSGRSQQDWQLDQLTLLEQTRQRLEQTRQWVHSVDLALAALTAEEKLVLHMLYICPKKGNVAQLCQMLNMERSSVYRKRDGALRRFATALYGPV